MKFLPFIFFLVSTFSYASDVIYVNNNKPNVFYGEGFDIDLLKAIYKTNKEEFKVEESGDLQDLFEFVNEGNIGAGGISITYERERDFDFVPYMDSGLKIMYKTDDGSNNLLFRLFEFRYFKGLWATLKQEEVLHMAFALLVATIVFSHLIWFAERGSPNISDNYSKGIWQAMYFCVVTKSTVGYGDLTVAKVVSRVWVIMMIFFGISMFGNYTGLTTASMIEENQSQNISSIKDLKKKEVGVKNGSYSNTVAVESGLTPNVYNTTNGAIESVIFGETEFVVLDAPQADYLNKKREFLTAAPKVFNKHRYGFVFPEGDPRIEKFKTAILKLKETGEFKKIYQKWF